MKAIVRYKYGSPDVLTLQEVQTPAPRADEVLVRVYASSVNAADWRMLRADPFLARLDGGLLKPRNRILGFDVAGRVEAVGSNAARFRPGDDVFGNLFELRGGAFAEYVCVPERLLVPKPAGLTYGAAAAVPMAAVTALRGLRDKGRIQPGQKVLINGASGGVGTFAVQLAKSFGAEVTAVCSARSADVARSLGADHVIDYARDNFTRNGQRYDLILAVNGYHPISAYLRVLSPRGTYVVAGGSMAQLLQASFRGPLMSRNGGARIAVLETKLSPDDLVFVKGLLEAGKVAPVIDREFTLAEVPDAIRYVEDGHPKGKVVIGVRQDRGA